MRNTDQKLAKQTLQIRERGYNPWRLAVFSQRQFLRCLVIALLLFMRSSLDLGALLSSTIIFSAGIIIGAMVNDIGFVFRVSKVWPFTEKITNWDLVKKLAKGKEINNDQQPESSSADQYPSE